ncbi:unnamed protein product [Allacma fusca]|uniref:Uncharacterized protein n=1 Tax=Allacma fusca TaxID=39272 RepID=A0A8J2PX12_9HEXA|nr:unnamed protein product [Allacma fusca]
MTSTLVETVSINYEDFNESFLTCGTCLCTYDGSEHTPKLLPCSHTVCLQCLGRIAAAAAPSSTPSTLSSNSSGSTPRETPATFRCPICRELINIPRGGVSALPPSFLVNQLLDLMASQRREVIPKCSTHSNQELLFCETCDSVFCAVCVTNPHTSIQTGDHTVIPFSIAIKRMSEILLYKANECLSKLDEATDSVTNEMQRLEIAADNACEIATKAFEEAVQLLEKRRLSYVNKIREVANTKREKLLEQLELISKERTQVRDTCDGLEYQVEVRHITKRISELSSQLDSFISLRHPRENAHLVCKMESDYPSLETAIGTTIRTSTTFPPLCTMKCEPDSILCMGLEVDLLLETRDYHNQVRKEGGDPVEVFVQTPKGQRWPSGKVTIEDNEDGTYGIKFTPTEIGTYRVGVEIFGRSIKDELFPVDIAEHNNPVKIWGKGELCQPVSTAKGKDTEVFVLDTGNARVVVLDQALTFKRVINNEALEGRSCTGIAYCHTSDAIVVVNWRSKVVTRISTKDGSTLSTLTHPAFEEPIGVCVDPKGNILVADNGARAVFIFDHQGAPKHTIKRDNFGLLGGVAIGPNGKTVIVADMSLFILGEASNNARRELCIEKEIKVAGKGRFGGVAVDDDGIIIATRTEKTRSFLQIFQDNKLISTIDSFSSKLKRPSDLAIISHRNILVVDLGNDCVKQYRYK